MNDSPNSRFRQNSFESEDKINHEESKRLLYVSGNKITKAISKQKEPFSSKLNIQLEPPFNNGKHIKSHSARINSFRKGSALHLNRSVTHGTIWRPPLQRSKPLNYLPYIQNCVQKKNTLLYLEQNNEEEEIDSPYDTHFNINKQDRSATSVSQVESTKHIPFIKSSNKLTGKRRISTGTTREIFSASFIDAPRNLEIENNKISNINPVLNDNHVYHSGNHYQYKNKAFRNIMANMERECKHYEESTQYSKQIEAKALAKDSISMYQKPEVKAPTVNSLLYNHTSKSSHDVSCNNNREVVSMNEQQLENSKKNPPIKLNQCEQDIKIDDANFIISGQIATIKNLSCMKKLDQILTDPNINTLRIYNVTISDMTPFMTQICSFQNIVSLECFNTNIYSFQELETLVQMRHLQNLIIDSKGNEITNHPYWQLFIVYRMAHLALKTINGKPITKEKHQGAQQIFGSLVQLLRNAPHRRRTNEIIDETSIQQTLLQTKGERCDEACRTVPSVVLISSNPIQVNSRFAEIAQQNTAIVVDKSLNSLWKQWLFQKTWTDVLHDIISRTLKNQTSIDSHMKLCMKDLQCSHLNNTDY